MASPAPGLLDQILEKIGLVRHSRYWDCVLRNTRLELEYEAAKRQVIREQQITDVVYRVHGVPELYTDTVMKPDSMETITRVHLNYKDVLILPVPQDVFLNDGAKAMLRERITTALLRQISLKIVEQASRLFTGAHNHHDAPGGEQCRNR